MPQMANITVKNGANVDVLYTALTPSSGDTTNAQWRNLGTGSVPVNASHVTTRTHLNAARNGRVVTLNAVFPHVVSENGVIIPLARQPFQLTTTVPLNIPVAVATDNAKVFANLLASSLIQAILAEGYNAS